MKSATKQVGIFLLVSFVCLVAVATMVQAGQGQGQEKLEVCHRTGSGKYVLISVAAPAVPAHIQHGDHLPLAFFADVDGDGFGDPGNSIQACEAPSGYVGNDTDCNDGNAGINPGATEACNGIDDDCDGVADEGATLPWYADGDGDGYGDPGDSVLACVAPGGYVGNDTDCDDDNAAIHPAAEEVCNGVDDDCDGLTDDDDTAVGGQLLWYLDADGDSYGDPANLVTACGQPVGRVNNASDCNDGDAAVHPGATEVCNGIDDDCDGLADDEQDFDGDGMSVCAGDCDDNDANTYPGAPEILCSGVDENCNGLADDDQNLDGDPVSLCAGDCDDNDAARYPGAVEVCDGIDNDCNPATADGGQDLDGDGVSVCAGDCDDTDPDSYPGAAEILCNGVDENCNGLADDDQNLDGDPVSVCDGDCDDNNAARYPGAPELCNGSDDDCDLLIDDDDPGVAGQSTWYLDVDGDYYGDAGNAITACSQPGGSVADSTDCDDSSAEVHPGQEGWFGVHRGDGSYDYNCDGLETHWWTQPYIGCEWQAGCTPLEAQGWALPVPHCGQMGAWAYGCDNLTCSATAYPRVQECH